MIATILQRETEAYFVAATVANGHSLKRPLGRHTILAQLRGLTRADVPDRLRCAAAGTLVTYDPAHAADNLRVADPIDGPPSDSAA